MYISELLSKIGFGDKDAQILTYLYERGKSVASTISKELNIPKSTVLYILYELEREGLVTKRKERKTYVFESTDPENIIKKIDEDIELQKERRKIILPNLSKLRRLKDLKSDMQIHYYDKEGSIKDLKRSIDERLDNKDIERIYSKNYKSIYTNEDFTFLVNEDFAIRFRDKDTLKKFISALKDIDETEF
ncbi:winged helix DNA-binding protein [Candidatus Dojkabacteria bacterium]|nr:winged helix DNA-binding protein [Candidatus Dojkabacteria bacterium]